MLVEGTRRFPPDKFVSDTVDTRSALTRNLTGLLLAAVTARHFTLTITVSIHPN